MWECKHILLRIVRLERGGGTFWATLWALHELGVPSVQMPVGFWPSCLRPQGSRYSSDKALTLRNICSIFNKRNLGLKDPRIVTVTDSPTTLPSSATILTYSCPLLYPASLSSRFRKDCQSRVSTEVIFSECLLQQLPVGPHLALPVSV